MRAQPIQANAVKNLWQNVCRKRKEKETANMLSHERNKSKAMDEELVGLRKQVESLKSQVRVLMHLLRRHATVAMACELMDHCAVLGGC
jgi:predicted RNase H-like nuclease (RuvC/YqgF family)